LDEFFKRPDTRRVMDRASFLNSLIVRRSFPWTRIFMDLEKRLPEGVRVVSISPRMREGRVELKLVVGAASDEGKLQFLKTLEKAKEFTSVQVLAERRQDRTTEPDKVLLDLVAWYSSL
jgi:Tfp pilus assembly protein PilN